jgi:hypothetical protein
MSRVAIYCRVSTEGQEQDGTSLKTQPETRHTTKARIGNATLTYKRVNPMPPEYAADLLEIIDTV